MKLCLAASLFAVLTVGVGCSGSEGAPGGSANEEGPEMAEDVRDLTSAKVTLRIPIIDDQGKPLSKHNDALKAAGLDTFPEFVEIEGGANGRALPGADKPFHDASQLTDKAFEKLKLELTMMQLAEPPEYKTNDRATSICYKGNPLLVVSLIESLTDGVFSDQLSLHGWRFRQKKVLADGLSEEDEASFPSIWQNWRGKGLAILTITASSDGGEETNVGLIPRCST
jgi:hypothetical protein